MTFLMYDLPTECASVAMEMSHRQLPPTERWRNRKRHAWCFMGQLMDPGLQSRKGDVHRNIAGWVSEGGL